MMNLKKLPIFSRCVILDVALLNKDDFTHLKAYNFQWHPKSHNRLLLWHNRGFNWSMSGNIKKRCLLHEEKTWTRSCVLQNLNFGSSKHRKEAQSIKRKQPCCTSTIPQALYYVQRNRLPNVQHIKLVNVRPPPKVCLINLFMSSLSPTALSAASCACSDQHKMSSVYGNWKFFIIDSLHWVYGRFSCIFKCPAVKTVFFEMT